MAALNDVRATSELLQESKFLSLPVKAKTTIYQGGLVVLDADGYAIPGKKAAGLTAAGRAEQTIENTGGDGEQYFQWFRVARGVFVFDNTTTAANKITQAHLLKPCYIEDDQTVTALADGASAAGMVIHVDADGVAVEIGHGLTITTAVQE